MPGLLDDTDPYASLIDKFAMQRKLLQNVQDYAQQVQQPIMQQQQQAQAAAPAAAAGLSGLLNDDQSEADKRRSKYLPASMALMGLGSGLLTNPWYGGGLGMGLQNAQQGLLGAYQMQRGQQQAKQQQALNALRMMNEVRKSQQAPPVRHVPAGSYFEPEPGKWQQAPAAPMSDYQQTLADLKREGLITDRAYKMWKGHMEEQRTGYAGERTAAYVDRSGAQAEKARREPTGKTEDVRKWAISEANKAIKDDQAFQRAKDPDTKNKIFEDKVKYFEGLRQPQAKTHTVYDRNGMPVQVSKEQYDQVMKAQGRTPPPPRVAEGDEEEE